MRPTALVGVTVLLLIASTAAAVEPTAYRATVTDAEVLLRAGPSDTYPDTGSLKRGAQVIVEREEGGWLAVCAPHGSVSWVAFSFVEDLAPDQQTPKHGLVHAETDVTIATGKAGLAQPLDVRREKIPNGTRVLLIGPPVEFTGKKWWPIAPPQGDVRYLPKTAVQFDKPAANNFAVRVSDSGIPPAATPPSPTATPIATIPGPGGTAPAGGVTSSKPAVNHPLWAQAEAAEREGRLADAEKAYFELAALMNGQGGDNEIANLCYTRIHTIREKKRNGGIPAKADGIQPPPKEDRGVRVGVPTAIPTAKPTGGANADNANTNAKTDTNPGTKPGDDPRGQWHGPGVLRRSVLTPDGTGKPAYALETAPGTVKMYVIAGPGVDLEKYLGKRIEVYGASQTRSGLSKPFMVATNVEPAP